MHNQKAQARKNDRYRRCIETLTTWKRETFRCVSKIWLRDIQRSAPLKTESDWSSRRSMTPSTQSFWSAWWTKNTWCWGFEVNWNNDRGGSGSGSSRRSMTPSTQSFWSEWWTKNTWCWGFEVNWNNDRGGSDDDDDDDGAGWVGTANDSCITHSVTHTILSCTVKVKVVLMELLSHSYGVSLAIWDHTELPATRYKWTHPALAPAREAGNRFSYPGGMEGWVDLGDYCYIPRWFTRPQTVTGPSNNRAQCRYATTPPPCRV